MRLMSVAIVVAVFACSAQALPVVTEVGGPSQNTFSGSEIDLVNQGSPDLNGSPVLTNYTPWSGGASTGAAINDGLIGGSNDAAASVMDLTGPYTITFNLNTAAHPEGYNITSITTLSAWGDAGRCVQKYSVALNLVGGGVVNLGPYMLPWNGSSEWFIQGGGWPGSSQRTITDSTGTIASGVSSIVFSIEKFSGENYREIDIFGAPVPPTKIPGDANGDRKVDFADYLILESSFGSSPTVSVNYPRENADFDNSGIVDFADYLLLESNFGRDSSVPEPMTLSLLGLGAIAFLRRR